MSEQRRRSHREGVHEPAPAPQHIGSSATALDRLRTRLLDLTGQNRLLNFTHAGATSLRVVDVGLDTAFTQLSSGAALPFEPISQPDRTSVADNVFGASRTPGVADVAKGRGWVTEYELSASSASRPTAETLPVLLFPDDLERRIRTMDGAARSAIEDTGAPVLYLIFGFLEWYESDTSRQSRLAPLLAVPVVLRRAAEGAGGSHVEFSGEAPSTNLSLVEKVRRDVGLDVPVLEDGDSPESYFARFKPILREKPRWRLHRYLTLGFLSFTRLLMYRDLDPAAWPGIETHARLRDLLEARPREDTVPAEDYNLDAAHIKHEVPPLVVDADSAQHSALVDAVRGHNLVIEGPPGTGKSQTITNLIAATLAAGKTVLVVSGKIAALDVVRQRLDEAGLGIFCLELHGRTRAGALLEDLDLRLDASHTFNGPHGWHRCQAIVDESKRRLLFYESLMTEEVTSLDRTVCDVLWARDLALQALPFDSALVEEARFPAAVKYTSTDLTGAEDALSVHAEHLDRILRISASVADHPWSWVDDELGVESQWVFCRLLEDLEQSLQEAVLIAQELDNMGVTIPATFDGLALADSVLSELPEPDGALAAHLLAQCRDGQMRSNLLGLVDAARTAQATYRTLAAATSAGDPTRLLTEGISELLTWAVTTLEERGLEARDVDALRTALERGRGIEGILGKAENAFAAVATWLGINVPFDVEAVPRLLNGVRAIEHAPYDTLHLRTPSLESDGADRIVQQAAARAQELERQQSALDRSLDISRLRFSDAERLRQHASSIENAWPWQRSLGPGFATARQMYNALARGDLPVDSKEMANQLQAAADYVDARARFELDPWCHQYLGPHFAGIRTNWTEWQALANWYREVFELLPDNDACSVALRDLMFHSRSERLRAVIEALPANLTHLDTLSAFSRTIRARASGAEQGVTPFTSLKDMARTQRDDDAYLEETLTCLLAADLRADLAVSSIAGVTNAVESHRANIAHLDAYAHVSQQIGVDLSDMSADLRPVERAAQFAETLCTWSLPRAAVEWLLCEDWEARLHSLRACLERASRVSSELSVSRQAVRACAQSFARCESESASLGVVANRVALALEHREALADWLDFRHSRAEVALRGLEWASDLVQGRTLAADHLVAAFRFIFYNTLCLRALVDAREPSDFRAAAREQVRQEFVDADCEAMRLFREHVANTADDKAVPDGVCSGPAEDWTGLAFIKHELMKQPRHTQIRQLVQRSGTALQALKPCFLMDPASVAQYLVPGAVQFDLVVVDEASELAPEEALGAVARGTQLVVAGDPKQLPPADVFDRVELDAAEANFEEQLVVGDRDSIFDMAVSAYGPVRRLRTHYRSMHPDLIAFSNRELYGGELVVCPPARPESTELGMRYHAVPYGTCDDRSNSAEAEVIVGAIVEQLRMRPSESLGVIALTFAQQELIEELFEMRVVSDPAVAAAHDRMQTSAEPLFIKYLGRVQGDERDVIFISSTYGADAHGNMPRRFGRISGPSGHRYVNVLSTRARKRTEVFCSLEPDLIPAEPGSPLGLLAFKQYLSAARDGALGAAVDPDAQPSTNFAQAVGAVLTQKGFDVAAKVGVAGMFVDLAVRRPGDPASFILGIECDGVRGPSSGSARDRHRVRQELLLRRGWTMHRVSSAEWFWCRDREIERLMTRLTGLLHV